MRSLGGNGIDVDRGYVEAGVVFSERPDSLGNKDFTRTIESLAETLFSGDELEAYEFWLEELGGSFYQ